jgi:hypothetical protein
VEVAKTILEQLGGHRFKAMTGARDFVGSADTLGFRISKAKQGINYVHITLLASDLYKVRFVQSSKWPNFDFNDVVVHENVYADQLQSLFTQETGLYTRL